MLYIVDRVVYVYICSLNYPTDSNVWTGGIVEAETWKWASSGEEVDSVYRPSSRAVEGNCLFLGTSSTGYDLCSSERKFLCEFELQNLN